MLLLLALLCVLVSANKAVVHNHCPYPVYVFETVNPAAFAAGCRPELAWAHKLEQGACFTNDMHSTLVGGVSVYMFLLTPMALTPHS